jgi:hypothetical protein
MTQFLVKGEHKTTLKISGNVLYVIKGNVDPSTLQPIRSEDFRFALGSGSPHNPKLLGEAIVIERRPYLSWVENGKLITREEPSFESPFLMGIDDKQILGALIHSEPTPARTLADLYLELSQRYPLGFALLGRAQFEKLHTTYLKKAPISHENINTHHKEYWAPLKKEDNCNGCIFSVVLPPEAKLKFPKEILERGFYKNPAETVDSPFESHTHVALLDAPPEKWPHNMNEFYKSLQMLDPKGVFHCLTESLLSGATFAIFPLKEIVITE